MTMGLCWSGRWPWYNGIGVGYIIPVLGMFLATQITDNVRGVFLQPWVDMGQQTERVRLSTRK